MKKLSLISAALLWLSCSGSGEKINIVELGAVGDGLTDNTEIINEAVRSCSEAGGGTVIVPEGVFLTATVHLQSGVRLLIEESAVLKALDDPDRYDSYVPQRDMSRYDSGDNTQNSNNSRDARWNRALILGVGVRDVSISGSGVIDGCHVYDSLGEEHMRGPHTILFAESENIALDGITVTRAANYAFMGYGLENAAFCRVTVTEGWDGIHIRGGKNISIRNCSFYTGDDSIAGGYWENMEITDNFINTSCNGIRVIMPVKDLLISQCEFRGPGKYPHRTSGPLHRTNMLSAINIQPGGWGKAAGDVEDVVISDVQADSLSNPFMFTLNAENNARNIRIENFNAKNIYLCGFTFESWKGGTYENVLIRDSEIMYDGHTEPELNDIAMCQPPADARLIPCWAGYANNTVGFSMDNVKFILSSEDSRQPFRFDNVSDVRMSGVFAGTEGRLVEIY